MKKENLINHIKNQAKKLFNKSEVDLHYSQKRLQSLDLNQLLNLLVWFKRE